MRKHYKSRNSTLTAKTLIGRLIQTRGSVQSDPYEGYATAANFCWIRVIKSRYIWNVKREGEGPEALLKFFFKEIETLPSIVR
jgi:hypothetical protein